jgi:quinoprotein dehydrogenase-associated probable ABC transporter substrate-binding protein
MKITLPQLNALITGIILAGVTSYATAEEKFKVCADPLNPPYSSKKQDGFENKIAAIFAKDLGQTLEYTWLPQRIGFIRNTLNAPVDDKVVDSKDFKCDVVMGLPTGYDMALTTEPYYQSTYVLLIAKGRGYDDITRDAAQLTHLPLEKQETLKIAMFDKGPGTTWLQQSGLLAQGIPYQSMPGDESSNVAMQIDQDLKAKKIDMVILWGPMAGYVISQSPKNTYNVIPMISTTKLKFDFPMSMGVRRNDEERKALLNKLIAKHQKEIQAIMAAYNIPLLPISKNAAPKDDD